MEHAVSNQINTTKLLAVEKLLWGHTPKKPGERMQGMQHMAACMKLRATGNFASSHSCCADCTGIGSRMRARAAHRLLVIATQYISFDATNLQLVYKQAGMPGPRPTADSPLEGMDAVCLDVRKIGLHPQGNVSWWWCLLGLP